MTILMQQPEWAWVPLRKDHQANGVFYFKKKTLIPIAVHIPNEKGVKFK